MPIFILAIAFDWIGAILALFVLKPLRKRWVSAQASATAPMVVPTPTPSRR